MNSTAKIKAIAPKTAEGWQGQSSGRHQPLNTNGNARTVAQATAGQGTLHTASTDLHTLQKRRISKILPPTAKIRSTTLDLCSRNDSDHWITAETDALLWR